MELPDKEAKAALDQFLAENDELEQLSARLATFNILRALKIEDAEIRHSNVLGWLLDPSESHGMDDLFLRRILSNVLLGADASVTAAQVELMDLTDVEVRREWRNTDLLVVVRSEPNLVVLIENKIGSGESSQQLSRYRERVQQEFPTFTVIPVFLTLDGHSSDDEDAKDYIAYNHADLLAVLDRIFQQRRAQMPEAVATFLTHYIDTLRRLTMQDEKLIDLCKNIYRKHRDAVDLIVKYGMVSQFKAAATEVLENNACEVLYAEPRMLFFIPDTWAKIVPQNATTWWNSFRKRFSVACWMWLEEKCVRLIFLVRQMSDAQLRTTCVTKLEDARFSFSQPFTDKAKYRRFWSKSHPIADATDEDDVRDAIEKLLAKAKEQFPVVEAALKPVFTAGKPA